MTDIHVGQPGDNVWPNVEGAVIRDLQRLQERHGPIDVVFFTGDAVQKGAAEEFARFDGIRTRLLGALTVDGVSPVFLTVPGNHDLQRPPEASLVAVAARSWFADASIREDFWENEGNGLREGVSEAHRQWSAWAGSLSDDPRVSRQGGLLPGDFVATVDVAGLRLGVVGLNTTFLQLQAGDFKRRLTVDYRQVQGPWEERGPAAWAAEHDVTVLLTHHPVGWLDETGRNALMDEIAPAGAFTAHLCGHQHEEREEIRLVGGAQPRCELLGRSLFGLDRWDDQGVAQDRLHGYSVGELAVYDHGPALRLWPRVASKRAAGGWQIVRNVTAELEDDDGTRPLPVAASLRPPASPGAAEFGPGPTDISEGKEGWEAAIGEALRAVGRSRSPILIGLDTAIELLTDAELSTSARHLTVTLSDEQVERLAATRAAVDAASSVDEIVGAGKRAWDILLAAQPRLNGLLESLASAGLEQPVAWSGRGELLARLAPALMIAHTGRAGADNGEPERADGFLSVAFGAHYFMPVAPAADSRSPRRRSASAEPAVRVLDLCEIEPDDRPRELSDAVSNDIVVVLDPEASVASLTALGAEVRRTADSPTRALLVFGCEQPGPETVDELLDAVPFFASGDADLAEPALRDALTNALREHGPNVALPCVVAAARAARVRRAADAENAPDCWRSLSWTSWSWIGLPLFAEGYGEVVPAKYPHLMDLRSVASGDWYFNRHQGIPDEYKADALAQADLSPEQRFHLYLSGAGGTGKSCFLRYVHDQIRDNQPSILPVWYRVDAPSSLWQNVERRVREETIEALRVRLKEESAAMAPQGVRRLGPFLRETAKRLRSNSSGIEEIIVFIDQLERTFESGDEPDPERLDTISSEFVRLLQTVQQGQGVRVFVASRKQYLPDFLGSSRTASECGLEFNVLQTIANSGERVEFVKGVVDWCRDVQLVDPNLSIPSNVAKLLVERVNGHPLNMMLALIQLLSENLVGTVSEDDLNHYRPWERLFALDLEAAARDDVDWYFLLAMSHARTEIVRFEEVWWRLRMVSARLTRQVEDLRPKGILERLWMLGFLGRTIHARPEGNDPARFVEFFHANLRDYLLREVMAHSGSQLDLRGRRGGTPPAWRALDRLAVYAHDWEQTQQLLPDDDVRVLIEHRTAVIEAPFVADEPHTLPFHLLFLRDPERLRPRLSRAATECFVFSALVHDVAGRWAFTALFSDIDDRVSCCRQWLERSPSAYRPAVLRYLAEQESLGSKALLAAIVVNRSDAKGEEMTQELADILAEPLYAARYRNEVVAAVLEEALARAPTGVDALSQRTRSFVAWACAADREAVVRVLSYCVVRVGDSDNAQVRSLAEQLSPTAVVDRWLEPPAAPRRARSERPAAATIGVVDIVVGAKLAGAVTNERLATWSREIRHRLGVPLPDFQVLGGEVDDDEMEFRVHGRRASTNLFDSDRVCVVARQWQSFDDSLPADALESYDDALEEDVIWAPQEAIRERGYPHAVRDFEQAVVDWLEAHCRRNADALLDYEVMVGLVREVAAAGGSWPWRRGLSLRKLQPVLVGLIGEGVPFADRRETVFDEFAQLAGSIEQPDLILQKVRDRLRPDISRWIVDDSGQVVAILFEEETESALGDRLRTQQGRSVLALDVAEAMAVTSAVRRHLQRLLAEDPRSMPVLLTVAPLRNALSRRLRGSDHRFRVVSVTELEPEVITVPGGLIAVPDLRRATA